MPESMNWFMSLDYAREEIGKWQGNSNAIRPLSESGCLTPEEFLVQQTDLCRKEVVY